MHARNSSSVISPSARPKPDPRTPPTAPSQPPVLPESAAGGAVTPRDQVPAINGTVPWATTGLGSSSRATKSPPEPSIFALLGRWKRGEISPEEFAAHVPASAGATAMKAAASAGKTLVRSSERRQVAELAKKGRKHSYQPIVPDDSLWLSHLAAVVREHREEEESLPALRCALAARKAVPPQALIKSPNASTPDPLEASTLSCGRRASVSAPETGTYRTTQSRRSSEAGSEVEKEWMQSAARLAVLSGKHIRQEANATRRRVRAATMLTKPSVPLHNDPAAPKGLLCISPPVTVTSTDDDEAPASPISQSIRAKAKLRREKLLQNAAERFKRRTGVEPPPEKSVFDKAGEFESSRSRRGSAMESSRRSSHPF
eukprot:Hpha_TRINITY_DN34484_c0_g1::TRINITY_DN34484_c0_g1_i1::g.96215::m.96215